MRTQYHRVSDRKMRASTHHSISSYLPHIEHLIEPRQHDIVPAAQGHVTDDPQQQIRRYGPCNAPRAVPAPAAFLRIWYLLGQLRRRVKRLLQCQNLLVARLVLAAAQIPAALHVIGCAAAHEQAADPPVFGRARNCNSLATRGSERQRGAHARSRRIHGRLKGQDTRHHARQEPRRQSPGAAPHRAAVARHTGSPCSEADVVDARTKSRDVILPAVRGL